MSTRGKENVGKITSSPYVSSIHGNVHGTPSFFLSLSLSLSLIAFYRKHGSENELDRSREVQYVLRFRTLRKRIYRSPRAGDVAFRKPETGETQTVVYTYVPVYVGRSRFLGRFLGEARIP